MIKKNFIFVLISSFLLTSCNNKNKIELEIYYETDLEKFDQKIDIPDLNENTKCYIFDKPNYAYEYNYNCMEGYNIIKEIMNVSEYYTTPLRKGGNHGTGLGYTFDDGRKVLFNQWKILESSKYFTDCYIFWIETTDLDEISDLVHYQGVYKSEELFYKFYDFHSRAFEKSYNEIYDDRKYGF